MHGWTLAIVAGAAPSLFLLTFFYLRDRWQREPLQHVLLAFGLGTYAMAAARGLAYTVLGFLPADWLSSGSEAARLFESFVLAGYIEESAKAIVLFTAIYHWDEFDEPLDGVVYGVAVALGFATLENFLFVLRLGLGVAWQRALFAVPAHALCGATMGYYAGRAKLTRGPTLWIDRILCFVVPIIFHGLYDYALHHGLGPKIWVIISVGSLALWHFVLRRVHRAQSASPFRPAGGG